MLFHCLKCENYWILTRKESPLDCSSVEKIQNSLEKSNLIGRQPLHFFTFNGKKYVLRNFYHGGVLGNVFKYSFWEKNVRSFREFQILCQLHEFGLPVVNPLFALKTNGLFYNQSISTEYIENTEDFNCITEFSKTILDNLFMIIDKFFDHGLFHPDLNIKNILFEKGTEKIYLLDLDKAKLFKKGLSEKKRVYIYKRLFRSFDKMGKINIFLDYSFDNVPKSVEKAYKSYLKISKVRSLLWIFNKK